MWVIYEVLLVISLILLLPSAVWRRRLPHAGWSMRLGRYPQSVTEALHGRPSLWVHAVSVGEVQAAGPLLPLLRQADPDSPLVLSTITPGGFQMASRLLANGGGVPIYFPLDLRGCVTRALDAIRPRVLLLMESELWPMTIRLAKARGIRIAVINGRVSLRAFQRYLAIKPLVLGMLHRVDAFLMQSQADADRILRLGAPAERVHVIGNLKWDASLGSRPTPQAVQETAARLGLNGRELLVVAGSTHRGEERLVLDAFRALRASHPEARLILAPRHLERVAEVEALVRHAGFTTTRLSQAQPAGPWDAGIVDTFGQLASYYSLATIVFIGGSLVPHGGQNPLEAASLGKPIVLGPFMHNFEAITHQLLAHHAARQLSSGERLAPLLAELVENPAAAHAMSARAQELTERFRGAAQRTLDALKPLLSQ